MPDTRRANEPFEHLRPMFTSGFKRFIAKQREANRSDRVKRDEVLAAEFLGSLGLDITVDYEPTINRKKPDFLVRSPHFDPVLVEVESFTSIDTFLGDCVFSGQAFTVPPVQDPTLATSLGEVPAAERTWANTMRDLLEGARDQFGGQTEYPTLVIVGTSGHLFHDSIDALAAALMGYWMDIEGGGEVLIDHRLDALGYEATGLFNARDHMGNLRMPDLSGAAVLAPQDYTGIYNFWCLFTTAAARPLPSRFAEKLIELRSDIAPAGGGLMVPIEMDD
jgi:hypothetical protein